MKDDLGLIIDDLSECFPPDYQIVQFYEKRYKRFVKIVLNFHCSDSQKLGNVALLKTVVWILEYTIIPPPSPSASYTPTHTYLHIVMMMMMMMICMHGCMVINSYINTMGNLYSTGVSDDDREDLNRLVEDLMTAYINTTEVPTHAPLHSFIQSLVHSIMM